LEQNIDFEEATYRKEVMCHDLIWNDLLS